MGCYFSKNKKIIGYCDYCSIGNETLFIVNSLGKKNGKKICMCCLLSSRKFKENYTCDVCKENFEEIFKHFRYGVVKKTCRKCCEINY